MPTILHNNETMRSCGDVRHGWTLILGWVGFPGLLVRLYLCAEDPIQDCNYPPRSLGRFRPHSNTEVLASSVIIAHINLTGCESDWWNDWGELK